MVIKDVAKFGVLAFAAYTASLPYASAIETGLLIKEKNHNVYHVIKAKNLLQASEQIAKRSGIIFKINAANQNDKINKTLAADDWKSALAQFLDGYNFTIETNKETIKTVIITGRIGSGTNNSFPEAVVDATPTGSVSLPDRYQHYKIGSVMPVSLPLAQLNSTKIGNKIAMDLPIGQYTVNHDNFVQHQDNGSTWMGYLEDEGKGYRVYLSQGEGGVMGNVNTPDGAYEIETVDGQTYLVDLERSGLQPAGFNNDQLLLPPGTVKPEAATAAALSSTGATTTATANATVSVATSGPVVDLMVLYTTGKQTAAFAKQRLQYLTAITNQAYKDSKINMTLRLVHTRPTSYSETNANSKALDDLRRDAGAFAGTAALRTKYGADLVFLFRPFYKSTAGSCGTTYVGFSNGQNGNPATGFGTISDGNSRDSYTNYYCGLQTFSHETGHSLGTVHDRVNSSFTGKFSYSYAWGVNNKFGTIMSYYGPSLMFYSTPLLKTQCKGAPCGYPEGNANSSDQTKTINYTAPLVKNFKPTMIVTPVLQ
jgi:hypothetical protein